MRNLKIIDRIAVSAILLTAAAIPLAANAFPLFGDSTRAVKQALSSDVFNRIRAGMRASEILELIGPPESKMRFPALRVTSWDYRYRDAWGYESELSVMVDDDGVVTGKFSTRLGD
jgi:hypothetical protein